MSGRAIEELLRFKETNLFLRGLVPLVGFNSTKVYYNRKERMAGESKYPLKKMLAFAFDGITSFSVAPIRFVTFIDFWRWQSAQSQEGMPLFKIYWVIPNQGGLR